MKIAIIGSRKFPDLEMVRRRVAQLPDDTHVLSGGAWGVDRAAEEAAKARGLRVTVYYADWDVNGKEAGILRNREVVDACDLLIAYWDGTSPGTRNCFERARKAGKPVEVHTMDEDM